MKEVNYIERDADKWTLTAKGKLAGGRIKTSVRLGGYIEWPGDFNVSQLPLHQSPDVPIKLLSSTKISHDFAISAIKLNYLFSELGWVNKSLKGWVATEQGLKQGAVQCEDSRSGVPYVKWPETITQSRALLNSIKDIAGSSSPFISKDNTSNIVSEAIEPKHRATDGHFVDSRSEALIDNWLYMAEIVHAYKRHLPIEENVYCDFYIPTAKLYIEFWNGSNDPKYLARKANKLAIYRKYELRLIQLNESDIQNLDAVLPRLLLKFGVQAY
ncbi:MAG: glycerol kinase [Paraglaciecola sp.]|uniref:glycerol kinase n=1 Tax=Paraglaciecola sp. TaxID=1920173 RepID=UPI0032987811